MKKFLLPALLAILSITPFMATSAPLSNKVDAPQSISPNGLWACVYSVHGEIFYSKLYITQVICPEVQAPEDPAQHDHTNMDKRFIPDNVRECSVLIDANWF
ncbi:MAG: hypothetical protein ACI8WB_004536 [Phenylobacterium sp.]|jgi:hypothetical protein